MPPALKRTLYPILIVALFLQASTAIAANGGSYKIGSGDILEIVTWKEPDLSRETVIVRTDGFISFPLINDVMAAGLTPLELKTAIEKGLADFVTAPVVTVTIRDSGSKKFYILGEIQKTGEYTIYKSLNVLQAFALSGGFTEWASKKEILLIRREGGKDKIYRVNYKEIVKGEDISQNMMIQADDTIIVP
ncbi:MAG: polysaccharide biosynthesis/export family protein [Desulfobacterales bacterium]